MDIAEHGEDDSGKAEDLRYYNKKVLSTSVAKLSGSARGIPSERDFHFYSNFQEFNIPIREIDRKSEFMLQNIAALDSLFEKPVAFPEGELDDDVAFDLLETVNDDILEKVDMYIDESRSFQRNGVEVGLGMTSDDRGDGEKDGKLMGLVQKKENRGLKVAAKVRPKIPFHVSTLPKPQDLYKINVNNLNKPFEHVLLQRSKDRSRFIHPLEKHSALDFIDVNDDNAKPTKPPPMDITPFKLVEEVKELKQLAIKLRSVDEFAVDLEHNQYRSFQGLTCLMQISTRTEDFVIDTLKLHNHIGPYLREVFKDPSKRKVLHGADHDILWLQQDFGIYICNLFDTGQASRVLKMERFSLAHLLHHFCEVTANKEYQNADWRIRPLPAQMIKYAREDTHYLLYIYDVMRLRLLASSAESESSDPPLVEVYKRSYNVCIQLYEKELLTDNSYLHIYGLQDANFTAQQLAVISGLVGWRDAVARAEDESSGYILPNRILFEIAKQMPLTSSNLRRLLKSQNCVERSVDSMVGIIRNSMKNAAKFEEAVKHLKQRRLEAHTTKDKALADKESGALSSEDSEVLKIGEEVKHTDSYNLSDCTKSESTFVRQKNVSQTFVSSKVKPTVKLPKKPGQTIGAIPGNPAKKQLVLDKRKPEHPNSSASKRISTSDDLLNSDATKSAKKSEASCHKETVPATAVQSTSLEELIRLEKSIADFAAELDEDDDDDEEFMSII